MKMKHQRGHMSTNVVEDATASEKTGFEMATDTPEFERSFSTSEDFLCSCCYDLMVQPTTLTCGHSFCRLCIANWYFSSKKTECPECRTPWTGNPQINRTLKNLLEKIHPERAKERQTEILTKESLDKIAKFNSMVTKEVHTTTGNAQGIGFCKGIGFALIILIVIYLTWYWRSTDKELLVHKPLLRWTARDVDNWLTNMGPWTQDYVQIVREKHIGGYLVEGLNEETLLSTLNITDPLHQRVLLHNFKQLKDRGVKMASNLWEFKAIHPGWALFLLYGLKDYPRSSIIFIYLFYYDSMFLPFFHTVSPLTEEFSTLDFTFAPNFTTPLQWTEFIPKLIVCPYWLIGEFTWEWLDIHYWTSRIILIQCLLKVILEINYVSLYITGENTLQHLRSHIKTLFKSYTSLLIFVIIWPIVPAFLCDCFFYIALYFSPFQTLDQLSKLRRREQV